MLSLADVASSSNEEMAKYIYGNRCGHNPDAPRYFKPPQTHKLRPDVIQCAINNLKYFYDSPTKWLKSLQVVRESEKQERTEGREGDAAVLGVLLHYTDLVTLRVGFYDEHGTFIMPDMGFIARRIGWRTHEDEKLDKQLVRQGLKPKRTGIQRVWRAMTRLRRAGYLSVKRQYKIEKNSEKTRYKGRAGIRTFHPKVFTELGVSLMSLERKRQEAVKRLKKKKADCIRKADALVTSVFRGARDKVVKPIATLFKGLTGKPSAQKPPQHTRDHEQVLREINEQRCQLRLLPENKGLTNNEFYEKYPHLRPPPRH